MKRLITLFLIVVTIQQSQSIVAWGFWGHQRINRLAVFTLPPEMIAFYKKHIEFLTEHAVDPDKRRYVTKGEAPRHYIDTDHYGAYPFEEVPRQWKDAVAKYTKDTLNAFGIVPWHTEVMLKRLTKAFQERDSKRIVQLSAEIGHYIGDGHVPLHTTKNYNGQLTNQKGIHGFWESRIPELYGDGFDYWVGKATYIEHPNEYIWAYILQSAAAVDTVLTFERVLTQQYPTDGKYCYEVRGAIMQKTYCEGFAQSYLDLLDGMVERRMRGAIKTVGNFWLTAWINAGQPDLNQLDEPTFSDEEVAKQALLIEEFKQRKIKGRAHEN